MRTINNHFDEIFLHNFSLPAPTALLILENVRSIGGYKENLKIEDWYMWLKLAKIGKLHYISEYLAFYRNHSDNMSKKIEIMHLGRNQVLDMYSNAESFLLGSKCLLSHPLGHSFHNIMHEFWKAQSPLCTLNMVPA